MKVVVVNELLDIDVHNHRVWFITGTSQGFGHELARVALERGDFVVATSRRPEIVRDAFPGYEHALVTIDMDVNNAEQVKAAVDTAIQCFGHIDILVNNAGYGLLGAVEEASDGEVRRLFDVNVFGLLSVTREVLPHMRGRGQGHVVNLSSLAGHTDNTGWGLYNATRFAVEGLSEALSQELAPLGIRLTVIEPGASRTNFLSGSLTAAETIIEDYEQTAGKARQWRDHKASQVNGDPLLRAEAMVNAIISDNPPLHLVLGQKAYDRALKKLESLQAELEAWRSVSLSTDKAA